MFDFIKNLFSRKTEEAPKLPALEMPDEVLPALEDMSDEEIPALEDMPDETTPVLPDIDTILDDLPPIAEAPDEATEWEDFDDHNLPKISVAGDLEEQTDSTGTIIGNPPAPPEETELLSEAEASVLWAKLTANWSTDSANTITANPCEDILGTNPDTGTTLTLYCTTKKGADPAYMALATGDVVGYLPLYDSDEVEDRGLIVSANQLPAISNRAKEYLLHYDGANGLTWLVAPDAGVYIVVAANGAFSLIELEPFVCPE